MKKNESGITVVPLIIALVLMLTVGGFFVSLMLGKHLGAPLLAQTTKALYIADGGIEYAFKYLRDNTDWINISDISSTPLGGGTFEVEFTYNATEDSITAASTGTFGTAARVITIDFERTSVLASNPVTGVCEGEEEEEEEECVEIKDNAIILCEGGAPCDPLEPLDAPPYTCLCTYEATPEEAPPPIPPTGVTWPNVSLPNDCGSIPGTSLGTNPGECIFAGGSYYFNKLELKKVGGNDAHVTVSGPVTIWILDEFEMKEGTTFNYLPPSYTTPDNPANVLLLAASDEAEFELKNSAMFSGAIYAPNGGVELKNSAQVVGAIVGGEVELKNDAVVTFDPTAGVGSTTGYPQTTAVKTSDWGEI